MNLTAAINGEQAYVIVVPEGEHVTGYSGTVVMSRAALEELAERDIATYLGLVRCSDELWDAEWETPDA